MIPMHGSIRGDLMKIEDVPKKYGALIRDFKKEVNDKAETVDPSNQLDWFALTMGWAIGKGLDPNDAHTFATYIRYRTDLG